MGEEAKITYFKSDKLAKIQRDIQYARADTEYWQFTGFCKV